MLPSSRACVNSLCGALPPPHVARVTGVGTEPPDWPVQYLSSSGSILFIYFFVIINVVLFLPFYISQTFPLLFAFFLVGKRKQKKRELFWKNCFSSFKKKKKKKSVPDRNKPKAQSIFPPLAYECGFNCFHLWLKRWGGGARRVEAERVERLRSIRSLLFSFFFFFFFISN